MRVLSASLLIASLAGCTSPPISQNTVEPTRPPINATDNIDKPVEKVPPSAQELIVGKWEYESKDKQKLTKIEQFFPDRDYTSSTTMYLEANVMRIEKIGTWTVFGSEDLKLNYESCTYWNGEFKRCITKIATYTVDFPDSNTMIYYPKTQEDELVRQYDRVE